MIEPNARIAHVRRVERGVAVHFDDDERVPLDPDDPRSEALADVLEGLRELGRPVYVEVDPERGTIARLLIPVVSPVVAVRPLGDGTLGVELAESHAVHRLRPGVPDFDELERTLRAASGSGQSVLLVEDDVSHDVIDVRSFGPTFEVPPRPLLEPPPPERRFWWEAIWKWLVEWLSHCLSPAKAQEVFDALKATSCEPLTAPAPCIPFLYPDDGCWARAHEMTRLMIVMGRQPKKVWIRQGPSAVLHVDTKNNPNCFVEWWYHVAPTLCVRQGWFKTARMVFDPALFTTPVTQDTWKAAMNDVTATLTETDASQYTPSGGTDPSYSQTSTDLATYRLALRNRSVNSGPPPYPHCL